jgi:EH domain-containing protein 1
MYKKNYTESLRNELIATVRKVLSPAAIEYGYATVPLEEQIKWRPLVLVLGNYSSGKSSMINDLLGASVQETGQAPTDDSFTIITGDDKALGQGQIRCTSIIEGQAVLADPEFPFVSLAKYGQRFAAHFRMKTVNSPFLKDLAIIDTPGMLDSVAEKDRGYDYQRVIGELAQLADLVLVMFDPHKAGTVRETYASLRETLPANTVEDRLVFVLNRVDECTNLADLLRVYGTLCWNLSQMTGRKDIPKIYTVYSDQYAPDKRAGQDYLSYLNNQRDSLRKLVADTPEFRLDHLAAYLENHGDRLLLLMQALAAYQQQRRRIFGRHLGYGLGLGLFAAILMFAGLAFTGGFGAPEINLMASLSTGVIAFVGYALLAIPMLQQSYHQAVLSKKEIIYRPETQLEQDLWSQVAKMANDFLTRTHGKFSLRRIKGQIKKLKVECLAGKTEVRKALSELRRVEHV